MIDATSTSPISIETDSLEYILKHVYPIEYPQTAASTLRKLRYIVSRWRATMGSISASQITRELLRQFRNKEHDAGFAATTINAHIRSIVTLVRSAGHNLHGHRLKLAESAIPKNTPTLEELSKIWRLASAAQWPISRKSNGHAVWCGLPPAMWWRAVFMLAFSTGLRRSDLFGLRWSEIQNGRIPTMNRKTRKFQYLPIPAPLTPWLELLRRQGGETVLGRGDRVNQISRELNHFGKLTKVQDFGLQAMRRAAARAYETAHPGCGRLILNHGNSVTEKNYLDVYETLRLAAAKLQYPAEFLRPIDQLLREDIQLRPIDQSISDVKSQALEAFNSQFAREPTIEAPKAIDWRLLGAKHAKQSPKGGQGDNATQDPWAFI